MPEEAEDAAVPRIVFRKGFSQGMADMLLADIRKAVAALEQQTGQNPGRRLRSSSTKYHSGHSPQGS